MAKAKLKLTTNNIITCALYAVIGILLLVLQGGSLNILFTIVGALFIIMGVLDMLGKSRNLLKGIVELIIGIAIITCGWLITAWVLLIFGVLLIIKGVLNLIQEIKNHHKFMSMLEPIVTIVIGIVLALGMFGELLNIMCIVAGVIFIINAVLALFGQSLVKK